MKTRPVSEAHDRRHTRLILRVGRQHLRLPITDTLQRMLGITEELVAFLHLRNHGRRQITLPLQRGQHLEQRPLLQAEVAPAVNQLEGLGDELDLANAAGAELDVLAHALAPHFLLNQQLHRAQRLDGGEIQVAAIDEGAQHLQQFCPRGLIATHHARLDHGVALPVTTLVLVVLLQRVEAEHQRAARAIWAQAHVGAEHEAVDGDRIQRLDQLLPQTDEELLIIQRALHTLGLATFGIAEDQVDVRRQVEFVRTELAHTEDDHVLRLAAAPPHRRTELRAMARVQPVIGQIDAGIGEIGQIATGFTERRLATEVAPDDAQLLAIAKAAQAASQGILIGTLGQLRLQLLAQLARCQAALQLTGLRQRDEHLWIALSLLGDEIAQRRHLPPGIAAFLRPGGDTFSQSLMFGQSGLQ